MDNVTKFFGIGALILFIIFLLMGFDLLPFAVNLEPSTLVASGDPLEYNGQVDHLSYKCYSYNDKNFQLRENADYLSDRMVLVGPDYVSGTIAVPGPNIEALPLYQLGYATYNYYCNGFFVRQYSTSNTLQKGQRVALAENNEPFNTTTRCGGDVELRNINACYSDKRYNPKEIHKDVFGNTLPQRDDSASGEGEASEGSESTSTNFLVRLWNKVVVWFKSIF